jgi:hypothetical protein
MAARLDAERHFDRLAPLPAHELPLVAAVEQVADDRMADVREVRAQLMAAAGARPLLG